MKGLVRIIKNDVVVHTENVMVTAGKNYIASALGNQTAYAGDYMGIGTDATAEGAGDTALGAEVGTRVQGSISVTDNAYTLDCTFDPGNPATEESLREAGIFTASTGGTLIARTTFPVITKQTGDSMRLQWEITVN